MGFFGSKSNTNNQSTGTDVTNQTTNFTQAPTNPDWVVSGTQNLASGAQALGAAPATSYVAGPNAQLVTAGANASALTGHPWDYDNAEAITNGVADASTPSIASHIGEFMDPYLNDVVNATSADLDHSDGIARANDDLALAGSGAFGGSGAALTKAATDGELARARATSLGTLRSAGFSQALGAAGQQAGLDANQQAQKLAAGAQVANIGSQAGQESRDDIASQLGAGGALQTIAQNTAQAPLDLQAWLDQNFSSLPLSLFQGQTGTEDQNGTETQNSSSTGKSTTFGFKQ